MRDGNRTVTIGDNGHGFREQPRPRTSATATVPTSTTRRSCTSPTHHGDEPTGRIVIKPLPGRRVRARRSPPRSVLDKISSVYMAGLAALLQEGPRSTTPASAARSRSRSRSTSTVGLDDAERPGREQRGRRLRPGADGRLALRDPRATRTATRPTRASSSRSRSSPAESMIVGCARACCCAALVAALAPSRRADKPRAGRRCRCRPRCPRPLDGHRRRRWRADLLRDLRQGRRR